MAAGAAEDIPDSLIINLAKKNLHQALSDVLSSKVFRADILSKALLASVRGSAMDEETHIKTADVLLSKGAWVNYTDISGGSAFLSACENNHYRLAAFLLEVGADPDVKNSMGWTANIYLSDASKPSLKLASLMEAAREEKKLTRRLPIVMNFNVHIKDKKIRATYDLLAHEISCVKMVASGDGGKTFDLPVKSLSGDIGCDVIPGRNLLIVWDILADYPKGFEGRDIKLDLVPYAREEASSR